MFTSAPTCCFCLCYSKQGQVCMCMCLCPHVPVYVCRSAYMCVHLANAELHLLCRSEARKIEQKELVMEGGVVGIGINLVRPHHCSHLMLIIMMCLLLILDCTCCPRPAVLAAPPDAVLNEFAGFMPSHRLCQGQPRRWARVRLAAVGHLPWFHPAPLGY